MCNSVAAWDALRLRRVALRPVGCGGDLGRVRTWPPSGRDDRLPPYDACAEAVGAEPAPMRSCRRQRWRETRERAPARCARERREG
ncbi:hypothetical protein chiPu_0021860 [Chiloscyllium punctatum]|uniref:Uncharacterized protein n=1 Tax=Chiloscyllium punctatum TaxID=137246 RepID=A0A401RE42_CHIPU|nr:hypothetical protein [Chiloscyllium punctatum]